MSCQVYGTSRGIMRPLRLLLSFWQSKEPYLESCRRIMVGDVFIGNLLIWPGFRPAILLTEEDILLPTLEDGVKIQMSLSYLGAGSIRFDAGLLVECVRLDLTPGDGMLDPALKDSSST